MALHIGIVGCSAEGAALCYRTICLEGSQWMKEQHAHPEVSMHTHSLATYAKYLDDNDIEGVAKLMLSSSDKLAKAGADFLICPDNTIHSALSHVLPKSPLPWLHIAQVVADHAVSHGYRRIGITGTQWLVKSEVYPEALRARGLEYVRPTLAEQETIHHIIMDELVLGNFLDKSVQYFQNLIERLKIEDGCDAVVLGCTEIPLIINDTNSVLPTLDSTRLLARAALKKAVSNDGNNL